eukprot:5722028-Prymnesium_polylepis.1
MGRACEHCPCCRVPSAVSAKGMNTYPLLEDDEAAARQMGLTGKPTLRHRPSTPPQGAPPPPTSSSSKRFFVGWIVDEADLWSVGVA